jgi:hypothetical protein
MLMAFIGHPARNAALVATQYGLNRPSLRLNQLRPGVFG